VELMQHQKHALAWLMWRESHKPNGGILGKLFNPLKTHIFLICTDVEVKFPSHRRTQLI
jgi:transcription termination factor 2